MRAADRVSSKARLPTGPWVDRRGGRPIIVGLLRALAALLLTVSAAHVRAEPAEILSRIVHVGAAAVEIRHGPADAEVAAQVERVMPDAVEAAERWGSLAGPVVVTVHATHEALEAATGKIGATWMRAWAHHDAVELQTPRTWSRGSASDGALRQILAHELTHLQQFRAAGFRWQDRQVPLWFQEGMASVTAGERHARASAAAVEAPALLLRTDSKLVYGTADRAFRFLVERHGETSVRRLLSRLGEGRSFPESFLDATGSSLADFERALRGELEALAMR